MDTQIERALKALQAGRPVLVADSQDRENEVDAICSAQTTSEKWIAWMVRYSSGYLCAPMPSVLADRLNLPVQWPQNQDAMKTCYTVSCDAAAGVTTGISAHDRCRTLHVLADPTSTPADLVRPGHILPLRAREGGIRVRAGHTEAAVDLMKLAGLAPVAAIGELVFDHGGMMRYQDAIPFAAQQGLELITVSDLRKYLDKRQLLLEGQTGNRVRFLDQAELPTKYGTFSLRAYRDLWTGVDHVAMVKGDLSASKQPVLCRIHSECVTGDGFGSLRCDCGPQLHAAMQQIDQAGGIVIYLRGQEGRGIGLGEKVKAYALQDAGRDTAEANLELGWPVDLREYGAASAILADLGIKQVKLLTNNPDKTDLDPNLVEVSEIIPLEVGIDQHNIGYLLTKRALGHHFKTLDRYLPAADGENGRN